jgi:hypothetical protein
LHTDAAISKICEAWIDPAQREFVVCPCSAIEISDDQKGKMRAKKVHDNSEL